MRSWMSKILYKIVKRYEIQASTHYYFGLSLTKLISHRILRFVIYLADFSFNRKPLKNLKALKNSKKGCSAILCGTGKSLDRLPDDFINKNELELWVVNDYFETEISSKNTPNYYCLSDPMDFNRLTDNSSHSSFFNYVTKINPTMVVPDSWAKNYKNYTRTIFYNDRQHFRISGKSNPTRPRKFISITLYKALNVMIYLGYDKIYLIGLDGSEFYGYVGNEKNELFQDYSFTHAKGVNKKVLKLHELKSGMAGRMQSYSRLFGDLSFFEKSKIINLNIESLIDAFNKNELF